MTKRIDYKNDLPNELIMEILKRLPVKSLMRFKCVSKSWFAIISDDSFAKSHFERSASPSYRILCRGDGELRSIDPDLLFHKDPHTVKLSLPYSVSSGVRIEGSCRGFVMLKEYPNLVIWNPSTGVNKRISYDHFWPSILAILDSAIFGFGYDASKDDYLAIIVWCDFNGRTFLEYFSMRINKWERVKVELPRPIMDDAASSPGYYLNGAIHWDASSDFILAFDMIEREFFEIPLPEPLVKEFMSCCLELLGGFLCLSVWRQDKKTEIWVMKEYGVPSSWTVYRIPESNFEPLYFTKSDEIIGLPGLGGLAKYDEKGELREYMEKWNYDYHFWMYMESLLPLPSSSGIAWKEE